MIATILELILVSLRLFSQVDQDLIRKKIEDLKEKYAEELSHEHRPLAPGEDSNPDHPVIDNAKLYSIKRELRDITDLYCATVQRTNIIAEPTKTG